MTMSDAEFSDYIEEQNRIFGKALDVLCSSDFRASGPINEQYVMNNWSDFKNRSGWSKDDWYKDINTFYNGFVNAKIGKKSILDIQQDVEDQVEYEEKQANKKTKG